MEITTVDILLLSGIIIVLEVLLALLFLWIARKPARHIMWFAIANLIALPAAYLVASMMSDIPLLILAAFLTCFLLEATFLSLILRKQLRIHIIVMLALAINFFSTIIGALLFMIMTVVL